MGANASKVAAGFDGAAAVLLRNIADGAETATAVENAVDLNLLADAFWHENEVPHGTIRAIFFVTALDKADGNEAYTLSLQVDDVQNQSEGPVTVWSQAITQIGVYVALVDSRTIKELVSDYSSKKLFMAAKATLAGTTPTITYGAYIADAPVV